MRAVAAAVRDDLPAARRAQAPHTRARRGFTILEVLVALAIFAMAAIVLASAYLNILHGYDVARRGNVADADLAFARSLVLNEPDREKLEQGGEFEGAQGRQVRWTAEITSTNTADLFTVVFTCTMSGGDGQKEPEENVEVFTVLRPTWSIDVAERDKLREDAKTRILEFETERQSRVGGLR